MGWGGLQRASSMGSTLGMVGGPQGWQGPAHLDVQVQLLPQVVVQGGHLALQALVLSSAVRQGLRGKMRGLGGVFGRFLFFTGRRKGTMEVGDSPGDCSGLTERGPRYRAGL